MARIIREPPAPEKARVRDDINANFFLWQQKYFFFLSEITMFLPRGRRRRWTITETRKPSNYKNFILTNEKIMLCRHTPRRERVRLLRRHVQHKKMNKLSFNLTSNIYKYSKNMLRLCSPHPIAFSLSRWCRSIENMKVEKYIIFENWNFLLLRGYSVSLSLWLIRSIMLPTIWDVRAGRWIDLKQENEWAYAMEPRKSRARKSRSISNSNREMTWINQWSCTSIKWSSLSIQFVAFVSLYIVIEKSKHFTLLSWVGLTHSLC